MRGGKVVHRTLLNPKWSPFYNHLAARPVPKMPCDRARPMLNRPDVQRKANRISPGPQLVIRQARAQGARRDRGTGTEDLLPVGVPAGEIGRASCRGRVWQYV